MADLILDAGVLGAGLFESALQGAWVHAQSVGDGVDALSQEAMIGAKALGNECDQIGLRGIGLWGLGGLRARGQLLCDPLCGLFMERG